MRILLMPSSYVPVTGGVQTVTHALAQQLKSSGHEVLVVTQRYPRTLRDHEVIDGVEVRRLLFLRPGLAFLKAGRLDLLAASLFYGPMTSRALEKIFENFSPDIVNVHFAASQTLFALEIKRKSGCRLVASLHGDDVEKFRKSGHTEGLKAFRALLREADAVTACSKYLLEEALSLEPSAREKAQCVHNGIDIGEFQGGQAFRHGRPYFFAYGRMVPAKGFDLLLNAFAQIARDFPNVDLILAGDGREEASLKRKAAERGLGNRVIFFGRAGRHEVAALLKGCMFVAVPSREESFGMTALEATVAGKPVVASQVGGLAEILPPQQLFPPTLEGLVQGLRVAMEGKIPQVSPQTVSKFSVEAMAAGYLRAYETGEAYA